MVKHKTAIYVDFDECLIHGFNTRDGKDPSFDEVKQHFETASIPDEGGTYAIVLRPGAVEFLKYLNSITPNVYILTAGMKDFQTQVATAIGLIGHVKGLYGRDSTDVPTFPISLLIDDLWPDSSNTFRKCIQMGVLNPEAVRSITNYAEHQKITEIVNKHYIQISSFAAKNPRDDGFSEIIPLIKPKLNEIQNEVNASNATNKIKTIFTKN